MGRFLRPLPLDPLRIRLAHALGFPNYPNDYTAEPYINYLLNQHDARGTPEYEDLLITIVQYFHGPQPLGSTKRSIEGLLHSLSTHPNTQWHEEDTVVRAIGSCTLLLSSFTDLPTVAGKLRMVTASYNLRRHGSLLGGQPYCESLAELVAGSGLLPAPVAFASVVTMADLESLDSLFVDATHLNAYRLTVFGAVEITWTHNISRHLLLSNRNGRRILEIFALPCALDAAPLRMVGVGNELAQEVMESYSLLFNAWPSVGPHAKLGLWRRCCPCQPCSARRYRNRAISDYQAFSRLQRSSEYDPKLPHLMSAINQQPIAWTPGIFPHLWSRIMVLDEHLQQAKPWSIWVLFRNRNDTLQFWTFLFATIVVFMTAVQVLLGVAQVVGSFR